MKTGIKSLLAAAICALGCGLSQLHGAIAQWTFDGANPLNANTPLTTGVSSALVAGTSANGATFSTPTTGGQSGGYLLIAGQGSQVNASQLQFSITLSSSVQAASFTQVQYYYDRSDSSKSPSTITWSYQIGNAGVRTQIGSASSLSGTGWSSLQTIDFTSVSALQNLAGGQTIYFYAVVNGGANGTPGNIGFDSFSFNGTALVPEPTGYAMAAFGLIIVGGGAGRYYFGKVRRK